MKKSFIKEMIIGIIAGFVSGFFSTGGGLIIVPSLIYILKMEPAKSRGTSVFCILFMVIVSSFFYYENNYIDWKIGLLCGLGGAIGGIVGAKLLMKVNDKYMKNFFVIFLFYMSYRMILG